MEKKHTGLICGFNQRPIRKTRSSIRGLLQLRTPSGPQEVESDLESELVEQLNFSPLVRDLITQPIIEFSSSGRQKTYACDVYVELFPRAEDIAPNYLLEVKRKRDLEANRSAYAEKFRGAEAWCADNFTQFRVLTEKDIQTPYLANARYFMRHVEDLPEDRLLGFVEAAVAQGPRPVASVIDELQKRGASQLDARLAVEQAVANWLIGFDFSKPFTDSSTLSEVDVGAAIDGYNQPIFKIIRDAKNW
jgi:hypothetical protein